jgi:hypothetical protein
MAAAIEVQMLEEQVMRLLAFILICLAGQN